jgi:glycolate oxidase FAD binding subunit
VAREKLKTPFLPPVDDPHVRTGVRPLVRPEDCAPFAVAGVVPRIVSSFRSLADASVWIKTLTNEGASVVIRGAGTKQWRPPAPPEVDAVLDTTRWTGIVEYEPADLTVTVRSGTRLRDLQAALRAHRQFFPVDPPFAERATVGGVLGAACNGALRQRYGALRDNVLGMRVCLSDGTLAHAGSRVVKSVAGYDLHKLFVGAHGTLGLIGEVTLRLAPWPAHQHTVCAAFDTPDKACGALAAFDRRALFPMATALLDAAAARRVQGLPQPGASWSLVVRCGGASSAAAVELRDEVAAACREAGAQRLSDQDRDDTQTAWAHIAELAGGEMYPAQFWLTVRLSCLPAEVPDVCTRLQVLWPQAERIAHPFTGTIFAALPIPSEPEADPMPLVAALGNECRKGGWALAYLAAPPHLVGCLRQPVPKSAPVSLMRRVKAALDPSGTFNPGVFLAGI